MANLEFSLQVHIMETLLDQPQSIHGSSPGNADSYSPMAVVVDHGHLAALKLHQVPLHPRVLPAWPQSNPLPQNFGFAERRLQSDAACQHVLSVTFIHF